MFVYRLHQLMLTSGIDVFRILNGMRYLKIKSEKNKNSVPGHVLNKVWEKTLWSMLSIETFHYILI